MILNFELNHVLKVTHFQISHKELKTQFFFFFGQPNQCMNL
jgi:hypothetical protein